MVTPEGRIQTAIQAELKKHGIFCFKIHGSALMTAGLPDLVCCVEGKFVGLEVKTPQTLGRVSPRQAYIHELIERSGGTVAIVASVSDAMQAINAIYNNL